MNTRSLSPLLKWSCTRSSCWNTRNHAFIALLPSLPTSLRAAGHARSLLLHLVAGRSPFRLGNEALESLGHADAPPCLHRWESLSAHGHRPRWVPPAQQKSLELTATRSIYTFQQHGVQIRLTFLSPILADDLELLSRPLSYLVFDVASLDGQAHDVKIYFDASSLMTIDDEEAEVTFGDFRLADGTRGMKMGSVEQNIVGKTGDRCRCDWGYACLALPRDARGQTCIGSAQECVEGFAYRRSHRLARLPPVPGCPQAGGKAGRNPPLFLQGEL